MKVELNYEDVTPLDLSVVTLTFWIERVCAIHKKELDFISYVFCSDDYLLQVNRDYLDHDYYTDIITFDYCEGDLITGDLFISLDRVKENATDFGVSFQNELHRVMIHGVLHLCGFGDKSEEDEVLMRTREDESLSLLFK